MLGDNVEVGCNSVLNPGTVIGRFSKHLSCIKESGDMCREAVFSKDKDNISCKAVTTV